MNEVGNSEMFELCGNDESEEDDEESGIGPTSHQKGGAELPNPYPARVLWRTGYSETLVMAPFSAPCTNLANFARTPVV